MRQKMFLVVVLLLASPAYAALQIQSWVLANGARVLFVETHAVPIIDINVEFDAGTRRDPAGKAGLASLTNGSLSAGIRAGTGPALSEAQISDTIADTGAQRGEEVSSDTAGMNLRTLSGSAERAPAIALLGRLIAEPAFPQEFFLRDRARSIAALKEALTKPEVLAGRALQRMMYGSHPYAVEETAESLAALTRDDLQNFHAAHYVANRAIVSLIGDMTRADADAIAQEVTRYLKPGAALAALPPIAPPRAAEETIAHPASQSHILLGEPAVARGDADYFPLIVGNYVLGGGGFVSRLMREVRELRGLAYSVESGFTPLAQAGPFEISLQTSREQTAAALRLVRATLTGFLRDGVTAQELKGAKDHMIGGFSLRIDNNRKILANIAAIGFYNLPLDYLDTWTARVAAVTQADIVAAFRRKVVLERMATVVVGGATALP
jgi:zinc protease